MARTADIVLIVNEDVQEVQDLRRTLQLLELDTEVVGHMRDAVERLGDGDVALVIANVMLPDGAGADLVAPALASSLPLILMTSSARLDHDARARALGACALLRKPFVANEVLDAVGIGLEERWRLRVAN